MGRKRAKTHGSKKGSGPSQPIQALPGYFAVGVLLLAAAVSLALRPFEIREADVFWHLASGRWIVENRSIPFADPFSHTAAHLLWADHEWLFQVIAFLVMRLGGMVGLFAFKALGFTVALGLAAAMAIRNQVSVHATAVAVLFAAGATLPFSECRPLFGSMVFLALTMFGALSISQGSKHPWIWLPLIFVNWGNFHATFPLGLIVVAIVAVLPAEPIAGNGSASGYLKSRLPIAGLLLACAAATLANPYGYRVWTVPLKVGSSHLFMSQNQEWRSPDASPLFWPYYFSLPLLIAAVLCVISRNDQRTPARMALLCMGGVFALLCMKSRRLIPYYAVAGVPAMAMGAQFVFAVSAAKNAWLQKSAFLFAVLAGGTVTAMAWQEERTMTVAIAAPGGLRTLNASFPVYCADILMKAPTKGNLFNDYNHGGYLHWAASPNWKVFIDGRNDLYGEQFTLLYDAIASGTDRPLQRLDEYKVNAALVSYEMCLASPNIAMQLGASSQWGVAGFDDAAILFVRKAAFDKEWLERNELRLVQPWQLYEAQASELAKNGQLAGYISELQKLTAGGRCRIAEHMLAEALADSGQKREALTVLDRAEQYFGVDGRSQQLRSKMR